MFRTHQQEAKHLEEDDERGRRERLLIALAPKRDANCVKGNLFLSEWQSGRDDCSDAARRTRGNYAVATTKYKT